MHDAPAKPTRPVLRYHGGKWKLAPWIISHFPEHRCYVEAFGGAASVLLRKDPARVEVYNDLDRSLVNLFRILRDPALSAELVRRLELTPFSYDEWIEANDRVADPLEDARRLIVCSYLSVGTDGVTRRGHSGFRNYSRTDKIGSCPVNQWLTLPDSLRRVVARIQGRVIVENRDAARVMRQHDAPDTLHYVDPPYPKHTRGDAGDDYRHELTDDQHRDLAATLHGLAGMVVLSGYPSELYDRELFSTWHRVERPALADSARPRTEVLWLNDAAASAL